MGFLVFRWVYRLFLQNSRLSWGGDLTAAIAILGSGWLGEDDGIGREDRSAEDLPIFWNDTPADVQFTVKGRDDALFFRIKRNFEG